ncbi:hypothetical protein [Bifidobacterium platyrrhinorum]|uniref:Pilus assembly protein n=1 Tax=Bifidobacterium platyrrhinorum TaxID=2661628 RepID=A0A6L9SVX9_9BIFI|nr:hypothetical protein [Bifidobacterium platyrrhinorum]NEG55331.1 hypothetical protein [Bifidobacterium platyrrhinorum]
MRAGIIITGLAVAAAAAAPTVLTVAERVTRRAAVRPRDGGRANGAGLPRTGIDAVISAVIARAKGGGTVAESFQEQGGERFASTQVTTARVSTVLRRRMTDDETDSDAERTARHLAAACRLSEGLGCEVTGCLEAVADDYRRHRRAVDLKRRSFAMPKATIRLLSALPVVTVMLGELMGARPVAFLLGTPQGILCLAAGGLWYAVGMAWTRRLLAGFDDAGGDGADGDDDASIALAMLRAALGTGAPIPRALDAVGEALGAGADEPSPPGGIPAGLRMAGRALSRGATWHEAWVMAESSCAGTVPARARAREPPRRDGGTEPARGTAIALIGECLAEAWRHGASPTGRLELAIDRHDRDALAAIEQAAARLSVRLLAPTGLCFLPSFILIGVVPAIVSFIM